MLYLAGAAGLPYQRQALVVPSARVETSAQTRYCQAISATGTGHVSTRAARML